MIETIHNSIAFFAEGTAILMLNPGGCSAVWCLQLFFVTALAVIILDCAARAHSFRRLLRSARPWISDPRVRRIYAQACNRRPGNTSLPLLQPPPDMPPAFTAGFMRPQVFLSPELAAKLDDEELESVLLHELSHVRRHDVLGLWLTLFATWILIAFTTVSGALALYAEAGILHVGALRSRFAMAALLTLFLVVRIAVRYPASIIREVRCDDETVRQSGNPLALASALIRTADSGGASRSLSPIALFVEQRVLHFRVRRLLDYKPPATWRMMARRALPLCGTLIAAALLSL